MKRNLAALVQVRDHLCIPKHKPQWVMTFQLLYISHFSCHIAKQSLHILPHWANLNVYDPESSFENAHRDTNTKHRAQLINHLNELTFLATFNRDSTFFVEL